MIETPKGLTLDQVSGCGVFRPLSPTGCYCRECASGAGCTPDPAQVALCQRWLAEHVEPSARVNRVYGRVGSYGLKHEVEAWTARSGPRRYVSNGAFIYAALGAGFVGVREGINCRFRMREKAGLRK